MQETAKEFFESKLFVPDEFAKKGGIWPLRLGRNIAKPSYHSGLMILEYYNMHFVMEGKVEFTFDKEQIILSKGDVFAMAPGSTFRYRLAPSDTTLQMIWISMDGSQAPELFAAAGFSKQAPYLLGVMSKELESTLRQLFLPLNYDMKRHNELCSILYRIFGLMIASDPSETSQTGKENWIPKSVAFMDTYYMEKITVSDVADYVALHRTYFSKMFSEEMGISPVHYLQRLRMEKAAELLSSHFMISEVSLMLGYSDSYAFTHAFSKYYGSPPGSWRATKRGSGIERTQQP
ncbi:AraC family transcriptional regulator [Paenibacillus sp. HWE-109]|uniref:AraC family transcriptional regulator n=1 Tax=Paenibacillus sp. HWE-109 TaxID=1306526 RepID=UPI001EDCDFDE|nr:AraC family transcriptional regulator [Paenibacillus sp. HWE-109]UKS28412.1 AraC family transcriptional regulator [Paenibacillus sp. HWE-109]